MALSLIPRFKQFHSDLKKADFNSGASRTNWIGWLLSLLLLSLFPVFGISNLYQLVLFIHIFFLFRFAGDLYQRLRIPVELLIILLWGLFQLLQLVLLVAAVKNQLSQDPRALFHFPQIVLLCLISITLGLIFVRESNGRRFDIAGYAILGFIGHHVLMLDNVYLFYIFQGLLLITLVSRTKWVEELSKGECWLYIILAYLLFRLTSAGNPFQHYSINSFVKPVMWYTIPYYLFLVVKLYFLAIVIKIPVVLIYHHASLSRKLKISGLFQSTFPQLIQLIMLLMIFYSFLSAWQADNLREAIQKSLDETETNHSITSFQFSLTGRGDIPSGMNAYQLPDGLNALPSQCVLKLAKMDSTVPGDFYLYSRASNTEADQITLTKLDSAFISTFSRHFHFLAGTSLFVHQVKPGKIAAYFYKMDSWQKDRFVRISPFNFLPSEEEILFSIPLDTSRVDYQEEKEVRSRLQKLRTSINFGRVFLPIRDVHDQYLAFDIVFTLSGGLLNSGLMKIVLLLFIIYGLVNFFIIKRVVRFGSQINEMIVQKFNQLKRGIHQISAGNLDYKIRLEGEDEFVELANRFNEMGDRLKQTMAESLEKDRFHYELQIARSVQLSLLPRQIPEIAGYQIAATLETANEVGGDFYDIIPLPKNQYLIAIGDVSGKGSSAALYMAQCMSLIRFSLQFTTDPAKIASQLNDYFARSVGDRQLFVTLIVGILDSEQHRFDYVRAGHMEPVFAAGDGVTPVKIVKSKGLGVGLTHKTRIFNRSLKAASVSFNRKDALVLYTDGIVEATLFDAGQKASYGETRLKNLVDVNRSYNASDLLSEIEKDIEIFYSGHPRVDDYTLLIIRRV